MSESKQDYFRCVVETRDNKIPQTEYPTIVLPLPCLLYTSRCV